MTNKLTRENFTGDFDELMDSFHEQSVFEHRKQSNFYTQTVIEISEASWPELDRELDGLWESNEYVHDTEQGYEESDITEYNRVNAVEETHVVTVYKRVEEEKENIEMMLED